MRIPHQSPVAFPSQLVPFDSNEVEETKEVIRNSRYERINLTRKYKQWSWGVVNVVSGSVRCLRSSFARIVNYRLASARVLNRSKVFALLPCELFAYINMAAAQAVPTISHLVVIISKNQDFPLLDPHRQLLLHRQFRSLIIGKIPCRSTTTTTPVQRSSTRCSQSASVTRHN
jgi:hypothetical protein